MRRNFFTRQKSNSTSANIFCAISMCQPSMRSGIKKSTDCWTSNFTLVVHTGSSRLIAEKADERRHYRGDDVKRQTKAKRKKIREKKRINSERKEIFKRQQQLNSVLVEDVCFRLQFNPSSLGWDSDFCFFASILLWLNVSGFVCMYTMFGYAW